MFFCLAPNLVNLKPKSHNSYFSRYFSSDSSAEMLAEWRPLLCPFDAIMSQGIYYLSNFLPTCLMAEEHSSGFGYVAF